LAILPKKVGTQSDLSIIMPDDHLLTIEVMLKRVHFAFIISDKNLGNGNWSKINPSFPGVWL
jgi:hypothetical protein